MTTARTAATPDTDPSAVPLRGRHVLQLPAGAQVVGYALTSVTR